MEKAERIKYLEEHKEETLYQIKKTAESNYNLLKPIISEMTMEGELEWAKNWIYKQADDDEYSNCQELVNGIDLKKYIDRIRLDRLKENNLIIYIKNKEIINVEIISTDNIDTIEINTNKYIDYIIDKSNKLKTNKVCLIHNHPCNFSAKPSTKDLDNIKEITDGLNKANIELIDSGIITIDDYWSYKQKKDLD